MRYLIFFQVIVGDADSTGIIQIYQNQTLTVKFKAHTDTINQLKILPTVSLLASASKDTTVKNFQILNQFFLYRKI